MIFPSDFITYQNASHKVIHVNMSDSTNLLLDQFVKQGNVEDGLVLRADFQNAGKGMMNNSWESEYKMNLLFSIYYENKSLNLSNQFFLSKVASLAVSRGINAFIGKDSCKVKWPNDAYILEKKVGGILIQNSIKNQKIQYYIIGIGVNVNQELFKTTNKATSLKQITGNYCDIDEVLSAVLLQWDVYSELLSPLKKSEIDAAYLELMYGFDEWLQYQSNGLSFEGKIIGVKENGKLIVEMRDGKKKKFDLKEISLIQE